MPFAAQMTASLPNSRMKSASEYVDPELQQVIELSRAEEELWSAQERTLAIQANVNSRRVAMAATAQINSTIATTNSPNLDNQQLAQFNALAQPFVPALASNQPWPLPQQVISPFINQSMWPLGYVNLSGAAQINAALPPRTSASTPLPPLALNQPATSTPGGGVNGPGRLSGRDRNDPPDPDPDEDPPDRKKRNKEIDAKRKGDFQIDSESLSTAKNWSRGNMRCEVERFER